MTLCPSGSSPNPSSAAYAWITWVEAQDWLGLLFTKFAWLMYALKPVLVNVANFCAVEPEQPVYPGDAAVVAALWNPVSRTLLVDYLEKSLLWWEWSQLCQCNAAVSPGCVGDLWSSHAGNLSTSGAWNYALGYRATPTVSGLNCYGAWFDSSGGGESIELIVYSPSVIYHAQAFTVVSGWNQLLFSTPLALTSGVQYWFVFRRDSTGGTVDGYYQTSGYTPYASQVTFDNWIYQPWDLSSTTITTTETGIDGIICTNPPAPYAPTPPDVPVTSIPDVPTASCTTVGDLCALFQPTIADISLLTWQLNLLQQRLLPFAWIVGTPVTGLTGTGAIAVLDILGVIVSITTLPSGWGQTAETPGRKIPAMGSIQADDGTVYTDNHQVHYVEQIILLQASWATSVRYNFRPGIVATVTPILPEP
jgi:hypothetical protein